MAAGSRPVPPRTVDLRRSLPDELMATFATLSSCDVSDAVGPLYTMDPAMRPLYLPIRRAVGVALTVKAHPGDEFSRSSRRSAWSSAATSSSSTGAVT